VNDAGKLVSIDENGHLTASGINEEDLIISLLQSNNYLLAGAVGLNINYANRTFNRLQNATALSMGSDFDQFLMYGGRKRCNVDDDGTITAFYGENNYVEDGSNGQVMVYQPKFYYKRLLLETETASKGQIIRHESLILSPTKYEGFKVAPIFSTSEGELDYVLLSAYEGTITNDKMTSVAGSKPTTNITISEAETAATARGNGWHITNMAAEATNQMLEIVEFGSMNG